MRKKNRIETCERWRVILQGDLRGNDVKHTKIAASKVLKTFKKRLEKANDERNNPDDCDNFDKANSSVKKLSHQLHSFLNIFTLIPTEKQLSNRFDEIF